MRLAAAIAIATVCSQAAHALEYPSTCRGPDAVVTSISGQDTRFAVATASQTPIDANSYCKSEYAVGASMQECVRSALASTYRAEANCFAATMTTGVFVAGKMKWRNDYKFPVSGSCGNDEQQAVKIFKMLCPNYKYDVETPPR